MLKTLEELSKLYGISRRDINEWITRGRLTAQKQERPKRGLFREFRYLVEESEFKKSLKNRNQRKQVGIPEEEKGQGAKEEWMRENANRVLSFFLACNNKRDTARYFGLNVWTLSVAFHIAGRDDLVYPSFLKVIKKSYPIEPKLASLATSNLLQGSLVPLKPTGDNFHANLIAFFKEVEENDKKLIELQGQLATLITQYDTSKKEVAKLRSIIIQAKEMMARGD